MSSSELFFTSGSLANIFWAESGFDIKNIGGIEELADDLEGSLKTSINEICNIFKKYNIYFDEIRRKLYKSNLNESLILLGVQKVDSMVESIKIHIDDLVVRINLCDKAKNMKAKIIFLIKFKFGSKGVVVPASAANTLSVIKKLTSMGRELCKFIFDKLKDKYNLGKKNYEASIAGIGTNDEQIEDIINSYEQAKFDGKYPSKIADVYRILLMNGEIVSRELPKDPEEITDFVKEFVKSKKICFARIDLRERAAEIPYLLINSNMPSENSEDNYRIILHISKDVDNRLSDHPRLLTSDIVGELLAKT
jgi:hypothetical protein